MSDEKGSYYINRIRLINFHNYINETVEVSNGGHMFVLGDNASGKTTLIDAIHYVITAGDHMEFNSAARIAGSKLMGRRAQGLITRYNVDVGHLNPEGGVTYAAIEIIGRHGKPSTVAIGMSCNSFEENLTRWGIIKECPLEEIPFLVEEPEGTRPRTSKEMKQALSNAGYYGMINAYKKEVANRFFGDYEAFVDFCRFLSMGKAYREIVSHSSDYHELFKKLLPPSGTDLFERIVDSLKKLEESREEMEQLKKRLEYIRGLAEKVCDIEESRKITMVLDSLAFEIDILKTENSIKTFKEEKQTKSKELETERKKREELRKEKEKIDRELADFRQQDVSGLIRQEKELAKDVGQVEKNHNDLQTKLEQRADERKKLENKFSSFQDELKNELTGQLRDLSSMSPDLPFTITNMLTALDKSLHSKEAAKEIGRLPIDETIREARDNLTRLHINEDATVKSIENNKKNEKELLDEIAKIKNSPEAIPDLSDADFLGARRELHDNMIDAKPVYEGLEWAKGVTRKEMSRIEELIGEEVLGTFIVTEEEYEKAADILFGDFPGIRLSTGAKHLREKLPDWIRKTFDVGASNPYCLSFLAEEMIAGKEPEFEEEDEFVKLTFRAHEQGLAGRSARLVGAETRRHEQQRVLKETQEELNQVQEDGAELAKDKKQISHSLRVLKECVDKLENGARNMTGLAQQLITLTGAIASNTELAERDCELLDDMKNDIRIKRDRLKNLRAAISDQDLDKLDQKIQKSDKKQVKIDSEIEDAIRACDRLEQQIFTLDNDTAQYTIQLDDLRKRFILSKEYFAKRYPEIEDVDKFIENLRHDRKFKSIQEVKKAAEKSRIGEAQNQSLIRERTTTSVFAPIYGFSYDGDTNHLLDRNGDNIFTIVTSLEKSIQEQEEIINEKTSELFRKIIMDELIKYLQIHIHRLENMVQQINNMLSDRQFGNNRYRIQLTPIQRFERFVKIIRNYNYFDPRSEKELRDFFEDYSQDILSTEYNEVPQVLDYRNWYHYEMKVMAENTDGKVMNKYLKSIGSGGEQAVPNYLLILTIAHFLYRGSDIKLNLLLFDEAFYGIDANRRDQLLGFATDLGLQLFVSSPDQDGVKREIRHSTSLFVVKDKNYDVHLYPFHWRNPEIDSQGTLFDMGEETEEKPMSFKEEL